MGRWQPNADERLVAAAMELFHEGGYDETTVQDIAGRAGLTERTFFRYFADKREVLFSRTSDLTKLVVDAVEGAPSTTSPIEIVVAAFEAAGPMFEARRAFAKRRQALIDAHPELRERELIKLTKLAAAISEVLYVRGLPATSAGLIAETGVTVFKNAFERWVADTTKQKLPHHIRATLDELRVVTNGGTGLKTSPRRRREDSGGMRTERRPPRRHPTS